MSWLLDRFPVDHPRIEDVFQTVGRAAYVAAQFDQDIKSLVMWLDLTQQLPDFSVWTSEQFEGFRSAIAGKILRDRLRYAARELRAEESEVAVLARARKARNALFHDVPHLPLHDPRRLQLLMPSSGPTRQRDLEQQEASYQVLRDAVGKIRAYVYELTPGCALVGAWLFQFHEYDQYFPREFFETYSAQLGSWILAPVWDLLPRLEGEPATPARDGAIR